MSNSLEWQPATSHLRALSALLEIGLGFFGGVIVHGGRALPPHPWLGAGVVAISAVALFHTVRRRRDQYLGTVASTSSLQRRIPPARLETRKPAARS